MCKTAMVIIATVTWMLVAPWVAFMAGWSIHADEHRSVPTVARYNLLDPTPLAVQTKKVREW